MWILLFKQECIKKIVKDRKLLGFILIYILDVKVWKYIVIFLSFLQLDTGDNAMQQILLGRFLFLFLFIYLFFFFLLEALIFHSFWNGFYSHLLNFV